MDDFLKYAKRFNQAATTMGRATKADAKKALADAAVERPKHPLNVALLSSGLDLQVHCSASVFECKGGLRPALLTVASQDSFDKIMGAPLVKKGLKQLSIALSKGAGACCQPLFGGKTV